MKTNTPRLEFQYADGAGAWVRLEPGDSWRVDAYTQSLVIRHDDGSRTHYPLVAVRWWKVYPDWSDR